MSGFINSMSLRVYESFCSDLRPLFEEEGLFSLEGTKVISIFEWFEVCL